ncbi:MAG: tripartite tricarboxylate transporter substrate-binding protein [Desulforhopalus sp.]
MKKTLMSTLLAIILIGLSAPAAFAYPNKPVSFVVPWPPGDLEDVLTRMIADVFQEMYDVPAAVVNKPGGGGGPFPGSVGVAMAPADGTQIGSFTMAIPVVGPNVGIEALKEDTFEPIGAFLTYPFVIATKKGAPYSTMEELAAYAKNNKVSLGHFGGKAIPTRVTKALAKTLGFQYAMDAAFDALDCNTLASGDADVINTTLQLVLPCIDDITVLASITGKRIPLTPNSPTVGEIVPELKFVLWNGLFVKKGTPQEVKDKVAAAAKKALESPKAKKLASDTGAEVYWMEAKDTDALIESSRKGFKRLVELNK